MNSEPIWTPAWITSAVTAVIALLVAFGLDISQDQTAAILGVVAVLGPAVVAIVARPKVTPNHRVTESVRKDGVHVAGEANPLPTGMVIDSYVQGNDLQ